MSGQFEGRVAVVTGGSFGIGRAAAVALAREGAKVVIGDVQAAEETVEEIRGIGGEAQALRADMASERDIKNMVDEALGRYGRLDMAFNNAGVEGQSAKVHECSEENWDRTIGVNLKGVWLCMKYQLEAMLRAGSGVIVNNSSIAGLVGVAGLPAYVASKHGVVGLTKNAALEYARSGIRVNAVCPGVIRTPMIDRITGEDPELERQMCESEPVGRMGTPEEVASAVVWLCSDGASFVTGHMLCVDGGWVAQ